MIIRIYFKYFKNILLTNACLKYLTKINNKQSYSFPFLSNWRNKRHSISYILIKCKYADIKWKIENINFCSLPNKWVISLNKSHLISLLKYMC